MATDEQLSRVRQLSRVCVGEENTQALTAVLDELTALRRLADAVARLREDQRKLHTDSQVLFRDFEAVDTALAEARK